jgi:hypothetical protein
MMKFQLDMALGEKLFEESGNVTGFKVTKVHPIEGVTMEVSFTSPSGPSFYINNSPYTRSYASSE